MQGYRFQNESELINRLRAGHKTAWADVINACHHVLSADIRASLHKRDLSDDLLSDIQQQTWLVAMENMANGAFEYTEDGKFYNWLRRISLMMVYKAQKETSWDPANNGDSEFGDLLDQILANLGIYQQSPEDEHILHEQAARIFEIIHAGLSPRDQKIITRYFFLGEYRGVIARSYGLQTESVSRIISRARKTLETYVVARQLFNANETVEKR
jgi:RNA polymerase sigma factor (sigma-70 family)